MACFPVLGLSLVCTNMFFTLGFFERKKSEIMKREWHQAAIHHFLAHSYLSI